MTRFNNRLETWNPGEDGELVEASVIRKFRITATHGNNCDTGHDNLSCIVQDRLFVSDFDAQVPGMRDVEGGEE